jgi:hypothetical protein
MTNSFNSFVMIQVQVVECNSVARERGLKTPVFENTDNSSRYFAFRQTDR